jgi:hypothetical protein
MAKTPPPTADTPVKRGRGRPPKDPSERKAPYKPTGRPRGRPKGSGGVKKAVSNTSKVAAAAGDSATLGAAGVIKRGRGRPRKSVDAGTALAAVVTATPKSTTGRGSGRPRKSVGDAAPTAPVVTNTPKSTAGRGRGRPRKSVGDATPTAPVVTDTPKSTTGRRRGRPRKNPLPQDEVTPKAKKATTAPARGGPGRASGRTNVSAAAAEPASDVELGEGDVTASGDGEEEDENASE